MSRKRAGRPVPEITRGAFPLLGTFLRGYLHEDWMGDHETAAEARDAFLRDTSADERRTFAAECEAFHALTAALPLELLRRAIRESLGSAWYPETVEEVRAVLRVP